MFSTIIFGTKKKMTTYYRLFKIGQFGLSVSDHNKSYITVTGR